MAAKPEVTQPSLFGVELQPKLIPFESLPRTSGSAPLVAPGKPPAPVQPIPVAVETRETKRPAPSRRTPPPPDTQAKLDFLPPLKPGGRTLKTEADAVIFCDSEVARPLHRATAAALDFLMIAIGFATVVVSFRLAGHALAFDRFTLAGFAAMLALTSTFYGLLFTIANRTTPGMTWTHLRLITFDGFPVDRSSRSLRLLGFAISVCSGGFGLFWALLDEENLTWQDHISKTFPALREPLSNVVRQKKR